MRIRLTIIGICIVLLLSGCGSTKTAHRKNNQHAAKAERLEQNKESVADVNNIHNDPDKHPLPEPTTPAAGTDMTAEAQENNDPNVIQFHVNKYYADDSHFFNVTIRENTKEAAITDSDNPADPHTTILSDTEIDLFKDCLNTCETGNKNEIFVAKLQLSSAITSILSDDHEQAIQYLSKEWADQYFASDREAKEENRNV